MTSKAAQDLRAKGITISANPQGSGEWKAERVGLITGSQIHRLMSEPTAKAVKAGEVLSEGAKTYCMELVSASIAGKTPEVKENDAMRRGTELEPVARDRMNERLALLNPLKPVVIEEVNFITRGEDTGCGVSLDGLTSDGGTAEIKCRGLAAHMEHISGPDKKAFYQIQFGLGITELSHSYFGAYTDELEFDMGDLIMHKVLRDDEVLEKMKVKIMAANEFISAQLIKRSEQITKQAGEIPEYFQGEQPVKKIAAKPVPAKKEESLSDKLDALIKKVKKDSAATLKELISLQDFVSQGKEPISVEVAVKVEETVVIDPVVEVIEVVDEVVDEVEQAEPVDGFHVDCAVMWHDSKGRECLGYITEMKGDSAVVRKEGVKRGTTKLLIDISNNETGFYDPSEAQAPEVTTEDIKVINEVLVEVAEELEVEPVVIEPVVNRGTFEPDEETERKSEANSVDLMQAYHVKGVSADELLAMMIEFEVLKKGENLHMLSASNIDLAFKGIDIYVAHVVKTRGEAKEAQELKQFQDKVHGQEEVSPVVPVIEMPIEQDEEIENLMLANGARKHDAITYFIAAKMIQQGESLADMKGTNRETVRANPVGFAKAIKDYSIQLAENNKKSAK